MTGTRPLTAEHALAVATAGAPGAEPLGFGDPTASSTHYCRTEARPHWRGGGEPAVIIGSHAFFNDIARGVRANHTSTPDANAKEIEHVHKLR